jgi:hypothetical protein
MNDLHKCLQHSHNVLFVDDVTLLISSKLNELHNTTQNLEFDLHKLFMHSNILELNDDKSTIMFIAKPYHLQLLGDPKVNINNKPIPGVYVTKILGVD